MREKAGGRLSQFWEEWRAIGAPQSLLDTLQYGYIISLREDPNLVIPDLKLATILEQEKMAVVRDKVSQLALKGVIERHLRKKGMIIIIYLDDLILSNSRKLSDRDTQGVLALLVTLGFLINYGKSITEPQQRFLYLRLWWDLVNWRVSLAHHRWD